MLTSTPLSLGGLTRDRRGGFSVTARALLEGGKIGAVDIYEYHTHKAQRHRYILARILSQKNLCRHKNPRTVQTTKVAWYVTFPRFLLYVALSTHEWLSESYVCAPSDELESWNNYGISFPARRSLTAVPQHNTQGYVAHVHANSHVHRNFYICCSARSPSRLHLWSA